MRDESGGEERKQQLMMTGHGKPSGDFTFLGVRCGGGAFENIHRGAVMLNKIEICRCDGMQKRPEIPHDGNSFEENFRKQDRGTPIEIDTARMHLLDESTEQPEIVEGSSTESGAVGRRMHVRNVRANREMHSDRDTALVSRDENAEIGMPGFHDTAGEILSGGFAVTDANAVSEFGDLVDAPACFRGHAELAFAEAGLDIFGGATGHSDFEIVDERGAVHGDGGNETFVHQVNQNRSEADLDDVTADAPEDGAFALVRRLNGSGKFAKVLSRENFRERVQEFCYGCVARRGLGEIAHGDFTLARSKRIGLNGTKSRRLN